MAMMTVRNLPDEVHRALRVRAALHGRSTEAEVRAILEEAVKSENQIKLGSLLAEIGQLASFEDTELELFERNKTKSDPVDFE